MRRALALTALAALALTPVAQAAPTASPESGAGTQFRLTTATGTYTVSLLVSSPVQGGAPSLRVRLASGPQAVTHFAGTLPASAVVQRGDLTTVSARLGAVPLRVVFHRETDVVTVSFGNVDSGDDSVQGWAIAGYGGTADVTLGSVRCHITLVATGTASVLGTTTEARPLAKGLGLPLRGARCADLPDESPLA